MFKKTISVFICLIIIFSLVSCKSSSKITFKDKNGKTIATITDEKDIKMQLTDKDMYSYIDIALNEAIENLKSSLDCDEKKAKKKLFSSYTVYTCFDGEVYNCVKEHKNDVKMTDVPFGLSVADTSGNLLATLSSEKENYADKKTNPCSSFKPLSVYAPAVENNTICWSDTFEDSPYNQVFSETDGKPTAWPQNANGKFSYKNTCVSEGIKKSLNTVAVKALNKYGVLNSIDFLKQNFDISLDFEEKKANVYGEDEVIGNIALGYIQSGCSTVDMAGYYQIFANGGSYKKASSIIKITDSSGKTVFENDSKAKNVIKGTTAFIMNKLLENVVSDDGTGSDAQIEGVPVCGKTGTSDDNKNNWFVGFTPDYVCAVWHGLTYKNNSPAIFNSVISPLTKTESTTAYPVPEGIRKEAFCTESGNLIKMTCKEMSVGFYVSEKVPGICNIH